MENNCASGYRLHLWFLLASSACASVDAGFFFVCLMWLGQESQTPCCQSTQVNEYELGHCHYKTECLEGRL